MAQVAGENASGLKKVEDDMVWMKPIAGTVVEPMPT
jgi:hypothetical protein